jgi:hypothetical protein
MYRAGGYVSEHTEGRLTELCESYTENYEATRIEFKRALDKLSLVFNTNLPILDQKAYEIHAQLRRESNDLIERNAKLAAANGQLRFDAEQLIDQLRDVLDYLEPEMDADLQGESYVPNRAMSLYTDIEMLLKKYGGKV